PAGSFSYRAAGDFRVGNRVVDAPIQHNMATDRFDIMQFPVTQADYLACVTAGACRPADAAGKAADLAVTGVNFNDATAYAAWLSHVTAQSWRLPTDPEWQSAAAERAPVEALVQTTDDPAKRWLQSYRAEAASRAVADPVLHPRGSFGVNSLGVGDLAGNVWEWTSSCFVNAKLDDSGAVLQTSDYCGVRVIEGQHRTFLVDFVRNPVSGGCSVGLPPDFAGFRLVRDE
ncbi:MAG: SUMF1/EgtB/PvdO family nonheme iron enzyme, partial [Paracoccaceae bacterium]